MAALVDGALERHGKIDLLVNNAGGQYLTPAEDINPKGFRTVMRLNVEGTWLMTHAVATKAMIPAGGGKVLSVTLSPHNGMPGMAHSGAARAAVENMMRTLSVEWARFGIKLNALAAGQFATDTLLTKYPKQIVDGVAASVPQQRMGEPEELAWLVAYLASPAGDFTSGSVITVDGARDNWMGPWPPAGHRRRLRQRGGRRAKAQVNVGRPTPADYATILEEHEQFWGERDLRPAHHPVLVHEFADTSVALHDDGQLVGYLFGFVAGTVGYVHLVGVRGEQRRQGLATRLWNEFEALAREHGATSLKAITTPTNEMSIGFHTALGMDAERVADYAGPGPRPDRVHARASRARAADLDHVLVAAPEGGSGDARRFYGQVIGLPELPKPEGIERRGRLVRARRPPAARAGVRGLRRGHARASRAAGGAPVSWTPSRAAWCESGSEVRWDERLDDRRRFYTYDPWGNRVEVLAY